MSARSSRARLEVFALAVLFLFSALATPAQAAESRGTATQDGWWGPFVEVESHTGTSSRPPRN